MIKRLVGPLLIVALGTAFLFGLGQTPVDAGGTTPCTTIGGPGNVTPCVPTTTDPCDIVSPAGVVDPCLPDTTTTLCPSTGVIGAVDSCATTTTGASTTSAPGSTTSVLGGTATSTSTSTSTTVKTGVSSGGATRTTGQLARTGSNNGPLTALGAVLILFGFGLLVSSTRIHRRRAQA